MTYSFLILQNQSYTTRLKRTELELELEKTRSKGENFFSTAENAEFDFIWNSLDKTIPLTINQRKQSPKVDERGVIKSHTINLHLATLVASLVNYNRSELDLGYAEFRTRKMGLEILGISKEEDDNKKEYYFALAGFPNITEDLLMYGLIENLPHNSTQFDGTMRLKYEMIFSKKYFRFRYWLAYNKKLPEAIHPELA